MSKPKHQAAAYGGHRARTGREKRYDIMDARVQAVIADIAIASTAVIVAKFRSEKKRRRMP